MPVLSSAVPPSRRARVGLALVVSLATLALDLSTKAWAWDALRPGGPHTVIPGVLQLEFAFNTGSAFGFLAGQSWSRAFFITVTVAALVYMGRLALTLPRGSPAAFVAIGLVAGGALGNLHDRLIRTMGTFGHGERHGVVDFIVVHYWPGRRWPAFNVADAALVAGVLLFLLVLRRHRAAA